MSIIVVLKEADTLIFSTDSRMMAGDYSAIATDAAQKIFEIAPETFIATSGRKMASEFQIARAQALAVELGRDIQVIGAALEQESLPCLKVLLERLRQEPDETTTQAVSGAIMLHGCTLVGRSGGRLGYVQHTYWVQADGAITCTVEAYFEAPRKVACIAGTPAALMAEIACQFIYDRATWVDPLEVVSMRWLEAVKQVTPTIGGQWQVLHLDAGGSHWISQPPLAAVPASQTAAGTCSATVSFTSPIITVSGAGWTINLDTTNGFKATKGASTFKVNMASTTAQMYLQDTSISALLLCDAMGMTVSQTGTGSINLSPNNVTASNGSVNSTLTSDGLTVVNGAGTFTGTLAAAIAAGKNVKNGSILN